MSGKSRISGKDGQYLAQLQAAVHRCQDALFAVSHGKPGVERRLREAAGLDHLHGPAAVARHVEAIEASLDALEWQLIDLDRRLGNNSLRIGTTPESRLAARQEADAAMLFRPPVIRAVVDERTPAYEDADPFDADQADDIDAAWARDNAQLIKIGHWNAPGEMP